VGDVNGQQGPRLILLIAAALVLAAAWALTESGLLNPAALFSADSGTGAELVTDDRIGDCREAGRDTGERCDPGADVRTVALSLHDRSARDRSLHDRSLVVELELTEAPDLTLGALWTAELYVEARNAFTDSGIICGLTNADDAEPGARLSTEPVAYALANRFSGELLGDDACYGRLRGSSARFAADVSGQPDDAEFRVIGSVKLEYPDRPGHPGSEDDFLVRATLQDLR